jgi:hypothetical protein
MKIGVVCAVVASVVSFGAASGLSAQQGSTITVRILDGKTGTNADASNVLVLFDHHKEASSDWQHQNDDGSIEVRVPADAKVIAVHATYDNAMEYYINCDVAKQKNSSAESWYPIADILKSGIIIPNDCVKQKDADQIRIDPQKGVLVVYVRKRNWREND